MVLLVVIVDDVESALSVLALSSRFDGRRLRSYRERDDSLSVLALSSRFDGPIISRPVAVDVSLSVLALSSRFDGLHLAIDPLPLS